MRKFKIDNINVINYLQIINEDNFTYNEFYLSCLYNEYSKYNLQYIKILKNRFVIKYRGDLNEFAFSNSYEYNGIKIYNGYFFDCLTLDEELNLERKIKIQKLNDKN